jgi:hypothetical protein
MQYGSIRSLEGSYASRLRPDTLADRPVRCASLQRCLRFLLQDVTRHRCAAEKK